MNIGKKFEAGKKKFETFKPAIGGAVVGAVAMTVVGFAAGWVVMTGTMEENVRDSRVSALAEVCEEVGRDYWVAQGHEIDALSGWRNEERTQLAEQFVPATAGDAAIRKDVVSACDRLLRSAS